MMKRTPNSGNLPVTTNDSSQTKSVAKTPKPNRRRSAGKGSVLIRIIAGILLFFVASIYILGTRYVLLTSPSDSYTPGGNINNILYHGTEDSYISKNHRNSFTESRGRQLQSFAEKPRVVGHYYTLPDSESYFGTERIDPNLKRLYDNTQSKINRGAFMTEDEVESQEHLLDSRSYDNNAADPLSHQGKDCVAQYDWQETSFPSCNILMEVDITNLNLLPMFHEEHYNNKHDLPLASSWLHSYSKLIANGHWRDVWRIENLLRHNGKQEETFILKTMRYRHDYVPRNYDRHRRDAIVMERLSGSKFIMDIYAACGNSGLFQFADGGDLEQSMWYQRHRDKKSDEKPWSPEEKMIIAYQAVSGLVDLHNFAKAGVPAVAHTDIGPNQYVYVEEEGLYKLNDFNRARFMAKHNNTSELCTYRVGNNPGKWRSPEEYAYERQTEKVDIYSLGNILYMLLTEKKILDDDEDEVAYKKIKSGERPYIPSKYRKSDDPFEKAILHCIERSWVQEPTERASARELQKFLIDELQRLKVKQYE